MLKFGTIATNGGVIASKCYRSLYLGRVLSVTLKLIADLQRILIQRSYSRTMSPPGCPSVSAILNMGVLFLSHVSDFLFLHLGKPFCF